MEKNHLAVKHLDISPTLYQKLAKIKNGAQKAFKKKNKMSTLTDTGDHRPEWSVFENLYVTIFAFYAIIKVSVNVLEIGVFTACNNFIYSCPKRKLKGSKTSEVARFSKQILQTNYIIPNGGCRLRTES